MCNAKEPSGWGPQPPLGEVWRGFLLGEAKREKCPIDSVSYCVIQPLPTGEGSGERLWGEVWRGFLKSFQLSNNLMRVLRTEHITAADKHIDTSSHKTRSSLALDTAVNLNQRL